LEKLYIHYLWTVNGYNLCLLLSNTTDPPGKIDRLIRQLLSKDLA